MGLTIYMVAQQLVLNYCRKLRHFESLYFASVANNILWWTFVKACFNVVWGLIGGVCQPALSPLILINVYSHSLLSCVLSRHEGVYRHATEQVQPFVSDLCPRDIRPGAKITVHTGSAVDERALHASSGLSKTSQELSLGCRQEDQLQGYGKGSAAGG